MTEEADTKEVKELKRQLADLKKRRVEIGRLADANMMQLYLNWNQRDTDNVKRQLQDLGVLL